MQTAYDGLGSPNAPGARAHRGIRHRDSDDAEIADRIVDQTVATTSRSRATG
ncbi:hypothetical protein ACFSEO_11915 [Agromyces cerinus subsp. nitratus]|uniref:hypothetical protein n=1 Tax=Agromyces cerinus TaxID=33878 RepID=UPI003635192A